MSRGQGVGLWGICDERHLKDPTSQIDSLDRGREGKPSVEVEARDTSLYIIYHFFLTRLHRKVNEQSELKSRVCVYFGSIMAAWSSS